MNSQEFLLLNVIGGGAFLAWYLLSRGGERRPSKLDLKAPDTQPIVAPPEDPALNNNTSAPAPRFTQVRRTQPAAPRAKELNILFNYNGHTWDAYEVLGVPAGASMPTVTKAYHEAITRCEKSSIEFLETAYRSILAKK